MVDSIILNFTVGEVEMEITADGVLIGEVAEFDVREPLDIEIVTIDAPSRPLLWGKRPLSDETLCDYIERVIMKLPHKQRRMLWGSELVGAFIYGTKKSP